MSTVMELRDRVFRVAGLYCTSLAITLLVGSVFVNPMAAIAVDPKCKDCTTGYVSQMDVIGADECQHGPENDPLACYYLVQGNPQPQFAGCFESNQGGADKTGINPANAKKCYCYKCVAAVGDKQCEGIIEHWTAWCGAESDTNKGTCKTKVTDEIIPLRSEYPTQPIAGKTCDPEANPPSGVIEVKACGGGSISGQSGAGVTIQYGCKAKGGKVCEKKAGGGSFTAGKKTICD